MTILASQNYTTPFHTVSNPFGVVFVGRTRVDDGPSGGDNRVQASDALRAAARDTGAELLTMRFDPGFPFYVAHGFPGRRTILIACILYTESTPDAPLLSASRLFHRAR
jgi:hypothetical protein